MKTSGFEIGHDAQITQGAEPLAKRLAVAAGLLTASMAPLVSRVFMRATTPLRCWNVFCQVAKGFKCTKLGTLAPPAQSRSIFAGENVLEQGPRADGPSEGSNRQSASLLVLLLATGPFVATQSSECPLEIGTLANQLLARLTKSLTRKLIAFSSCAEPAEGSMGI
jgi:hypothetical protein